jgi:hypothetical protein
LSAPDKWEILPDIQKRRFKQEGGVQYPAKYVPKPEEGAPRGALKILKSYHPGKYTVRRWRLPAASTLPYYLQF